MITVCARRDRSQSNEVRSDDQPIGHAPQSGTFLRESERNAIGKGGWRHRLLWGSVQRWGCQFQSALRSRRPTLLRNGSGRLHPQSLDAPYALRTVAPNVVRADLSRQPPSSDAQHQVQPSHLPESRSARQCRQGGRLSPPASAGIRRLPSFGAP
jgi:hypothetical protein